MNDWQSLGIGGLIVVFVIKELFSFLKNRNGKGNKSGDMSPDYWKSAIKEGMADSLKNSISPILNRQTDILDAIRESQVRMVTIIERMNHK